MKTLIGMGEERDDLYYFKPVTTIFFLQTSGSVSLEVWHKVLVTPPLIMFLILFLALKPWIFMIVVLMGSILVYLLNWF